MISQFKMIMTYAQQSQLITLSINSVMSIVIMFSYCCHLIVPRLLSAVTTNRQKFNMLFNLCNVRNVKEFLFNLESPIVYDFWR